MNGVGLRGLSRKQAADIIQGEKVRGGREVIFRGDVDFYFLLIF